MNIVIAIDSFKGSLSSVEAGRAAEKGIRTGQILRYVLWQTAEKVRRRLL